MAFGAKKSSPIKGYRDLFKDEMAGAESTEGQKDYHRPTRKPPLDPSVFPRASAPANILSNKKGLNPLSLAMRDERVPRSRIPFVRPQASLPPSYLSKLRYSQSEWKMEIKSFEAINSTKKSQSPSDIVRLSFDSAVEEKRAPGKYLMHHPSSVYSDRSLPILSKEAKDSYTNSSHQQKDQLDLSNAPLDFTPSSFASQQQPNRTTTAAADNNETQTPYSTRNVPFMLEIWQKTEGVDLDKMMQQEQDNARFQRVKMSQKVEALARDKGFDLKENDLVKRAIHRKQALAEQQYLTDLNNATVVTEPQTRDEVVHQLADTLTTITDSPATSVSLSSTAKSRRLVAPFAVGVAMDALAEEPTGETTTQEVFESHENGHRPLSSVDQASNKVPNLVSNTSTSKLSKSTLKVLQKLSQDHPTTASRINLLDQYDVLPNPESKIRFTLMGPESAQTLTEMPMYSLSNGAKSLQPISVARKRGVSMYTPGAYNQLLQSSFDAHGEIIVLHDDPKDENQQRRESKGNFRLTLPEFVGTHSRSSLGSELESDKDDELQEAFLSLENPLLNMTPIDLIYGPNETNDELGSTADFYPPALTRETSQQHSIPLSAVQRRLSLFSRRLSVIANQNNNQKKPMLSFAELKSLAEEKKIAARLASGKKYFCLSRFNEFVMSFLKAHNDFDPEDLYGLPTMPTTAIPINGFHDYMRSKLPKMEYAPDPGNVDRINLVRVLSLALRQELSYPLRLESASLLIQSGLGLELSRHDVFLFQSFLSIMLRESTEYYRDMAALSFCENGLVDDFVIQHLMTGLGDVDCTRRAKINSLISKLESKHTKSVVCILLSETRNLNFKIRQDAVWHLGTYVKRMFDAIKSNGAQTNPGNEKSWSSYDSNEFISQKEEVSAAHSAEIPEQSAPPTVEKRVYFDLDAKEMTFEMLIDESIDILLRIMWDDWVVDVRDAASQTLGKLGQGTAVFDRIVMLMQHQDMHKRVEALKCFYFMSVMTQPALKSLIVCLSDPYMIVRIQACKVACALRSENIGLIHALLDRLEDFEWSVRAYAVKAIGLSNCRSPKVRTSLNWTLIHDTSPSVRIESIYAFKNLGYLENDTGVRDWLLTMIQQDESDTVRRVLEFVLVDMGVLLPAAVDFSSDTKESSPLESASAAFTAAILSRIPAHLSLPYPHLLTGRSKDEVGIYLRDSLIEDKEALEVIQKVKHLAAKDKVIEQVLYLDRNSGILPKVQVDLDINKTFRPDLQGIHDAHKKKKNRGVLH